MNDIIFAGNVDPNYVPTIPEEVFTIIPAIIVFSLLVVFASKASAFFKNIIHRRKDADRRDPVRLYTPTQKNVARQRCGSRCEYGLIFRCSKTVDNLQGDHWYPHARGGVTNEKNLVMLCPSCNRSKGDKIPSSAMTMSIALRRRLFYNGSFNNMGYYAPGQWSPLWGGRKSKSTSKFTSK